MLKTTGSMRFLLQRSISMIPEFQRAPRLLSALPAPDRCRYQAMRTPSMSIRFSTSNRGRLESWRNQSKET